MIASTITILYIWSATVKGNYDIYYSWRAEGEYATLALCEDAQRRLGIADPSKSRCSPTGRTK